MIGFSYCSGLSNSRNAYPTDSLFSSGRMRPSVVRGPEQAGVASLVAVQTMRCMETPQFER
eukprot:9492281-Pyramimonas_sp.AAC.1